ncbi:MAG TPA: class I SAM-dependent methyltransferase [Roseiflexaceae bacterium]|nr:class I SAM-dependent methyltransferase [Roseiflexaceae bacterium]HMP39531.1 class I SAM-dependent methyltransferase [Roseiflexaceae bacterium]
MNPHFAAVYRSLIIAHRLHPPLRARRILDVGCDDGFLMRSIHAETRLGIDLNPRLLPDDEVAVLRASATDLPLLDATFDCILAFDILEHVADDRSMMREMLRVLTPDGAIWFSTPAAAFRMLPEFITPYANRGFGHVRNGYTPATLQALLPDPAAWQIDWFYWNEPLWRRIFAPMHLLHVLVPAAAVALTHLCFRIDALLADGDRGHLFGVIRRR